MVGEWRAAMGGGEFRELFGKLDGRLSWDEFDEIRPNGVVKRGKGRTKFCPIVMAHGGCGSGRHVGFHRP